MTPTFCQQRQEIFAHHPAHHAPDRQPPRLGVAVGDEDLAHQPPIGAARRAAAAPRAFLDRLPVAGDIGLG